MALLLVLWVFMTLGVLAFDFAQDMRNDAQAAMNVAEETQAYYVAVAGLNRALWELQEADERDPEVIDAWPPDLGFPFAPADDRWHEGMFRDAKYRVRVQSESGRIPINCGIEDGDPNTRRELLKAVLQNLVTGGNRTEGIDRRADVEIRTVADSIIDWTDFDNEAQPNGAENSYYMKLVPPYRAKNNLVTSAEELLGVKGMTADLLYGTPDHPGLRDVITVYQVEDDEGACQINVGHVTAPVLQALLGVEPDVAAELISRRDAAAVDENEQQVVLDSIRIAAAPALGKLAPEVLEELFVWPVSGEGGEAEILTVEAEADLGQTRNRSHVMAVIERGGDNGVSVKRWYDRAPWSFGPADGTIEQRDTVG